MEMPPPPPRADYAVTIDYLLPDDYAATPCCRQLMLYAFASARGLRCRQIDAFEIADAAVMLRLFSITITRLEAGCSATPDYAAAD